MKNDFSKPEVKDCGGDMSKKWHIYYRVFNPMTGRVETIRDYFGLFRIKELKRRYEVALEKCNEIYQKLQSGWRPFDVVCIENKLSYSFERKMFKSYVIVNSIEAVVSEFLAHGKFTDSMRVEITSKARGFVLWLKSKKLNNVQMALIDNATVVSFFEFIIEKLELSGNTVKKYRQTLLSLWDYGISKKYAAHNIVTNLPVCSREKDEAAKPIRKEDLEKFWKEIQKDPMLELACKLELFGLMRPGKEVRFLKVGMIDFPKSVINLPADIVKNTNPNRRRSKTVTVPEHLLCEMVDRYRLHDYPKDFYVFGKYGVPGLEHLGKNNLRTRFRTIRENLKLPNYYKLYSFKHTGVAALMDMNFHPNEIAQQAGWSSTYTLEIYARHKEVSANKNILENFKI
jgi:integrase